MLAFGAFAFSLDGRFFGKIHTLALNREGADRTGRVASPRHEADNRTACAARPI